MTVNRMRSNGLMLCHRRFWLDVRNSFFSGKVERHWHRLHREVVESLSLGAFKKSGAVALRDMVYGHGGDGLMVGLRSLSGLF